MKNIQLSKISRCVLAWLMLLLAGCNKLVQVETPGHLVDSEVLFQSKKGYEAALAGIFLQMRMLNLSMTNGGLSVYMGVSADEIYPTLVLGDEDEFYKNQLLSSNNAVNNFWLYAYRGIYRANLLIKHAELDQQLISADRDNFHGQALFLRAFFHFYLCQLFGDVPLISSTDYKLNASKGRDSKALVMEAVEKDLAKALQLLPKTIDTKRILPNYYAALALAARVDLYQGKYAQAVSRTVELLQNPNFKLENDLTTTFKINSKETIWQLASEASNTAEAMNFIPFNAMSKPLYVLQNELLNTFEPEDLRMLQWIGANTINGVDYRYPAKYKNKLMTPVDEYNVVFRLAEIHLIQAEALIRLGDQENALIALNTIRKRAGLAARSFKDEKQLWDNLVVERRKELFAEWGHRWFDLIRWNVADKVLGAAKDNWQVYATYLPIPRTEILLNPYLTQNPGYHE